jgi:hypothetical protein
MEGRFFMHLSEERALEMATAVKFKAFMEIKAAMGVEELTITYNRHGVATREVEQCCQIAVYTTILLKYSGK